ARGGAPPPSGCEAGAPRADPAASRRPAPCRSRPAAGARRRPSDAAALSSVPFHLPLQALELLLEGDHLQLAADDDLLELLEVEDLLLQLPLRLLEVAHDLLVLAHVAEDADRADHLPVGVTEG